MVLNYVIKIIHQFIAILFYKKVIFLSVVLLNELSDYVRRWREKKLISDSSFFILIEQV